MRTVTIIAISIACLFAANAVVLADETYEVVADSTMDGNAGSLVRITDPGYVGETFFAFEESGMYRVYAVREDGDVWYILPGLQYLCPTNSMNINDTWRFIDDGVTETVAKVVAVELVATGAGTFSCYKVDVERVGSPGNPIQRLWFAWGVGVVKQVDVVPVPWQSDLQSYFVSSSTTFFPLTTGNVWQYMEIFVPTEETSWGAIKSLFE